MKDGKYKIRTWNSMASQYGLRDHDSIAVEYSFTEEMERAMPESRIIDLKNDSWSGYNFSKGMIDNEYEHVINCIVLQPESNKDVQFTLTATLKGNPLELAPETVQAITELLI